jgi:2-oxoglutarate ferredoxin oxidoreductase subunit alpha
MNQVLLETGDAVFQKRFLQGSEALVEGALAAGLRFYAGYPITPSTEIAELLSSRLPRRKGVFIQMEDEIASIGAVLGASLAGLKSLTATSGPGFSLMQELIGYAGLAQIPCVIVDVMRGGPSTGMPTMPSQGDVQQAVWGTHGDHPVVVVAPASVTEMYFLAVWCMNISEKLRIPVIFLPDEIIAHMRERVLIPPQEVLRNVNRAMPAEPPGEFKPYRFSGSAVAAMPPLGAGYRYNVTGLIYDESGFPTNQSARAGELVDYLLDKVMRREDELVFYEETGTEDAEEIIIAYGSVARSAESAVKTLRQQGRKAGLFRLITLHPFPEKRLKQLARKCGKFLLSEMNKGQLIIPVRAAIGSNAELKCVHKADGHPVFPHEIVAAAGAKAAGRKPELRDAEWGAHE